MCKFYKRYAHTMNAKLQRNWTKFLVLFAIYVIVAAYLFVSTANNKMNEAVNKIDYIYRNQMQIKGIKIPGNLADNFIEIKDAGLKKDTVQKSHSVSHQNHPVSVYRSKEKDNLVNKAKMIAAVTNRDNKNDKVKDVVPLLPSKQPEKKSKSMALSSVKILPKKLANFTKKPRTTLITKLIKIDKLSNNQKLPSPTKGTSKPLVLKPPKMSFFPSRLVPPKDICSDSPFLLVYVHSAISHFINRLSIRKTWANPLWYKKYLPVENLLKVVFVLGTTEDEKLQQKTEIEADLYNDILIGDFIDSYKNLTYKAVHALGWIKDNCKSAKFVLKVDDDILVDVFKLYRFLSKQVRLEPEVYSRNLIACCVWHGMQVMREGKWYVPRERYNKTVYPEYCSGHGYIMTTDAVSKLYSAARLVDYFFIDDVYVTGFLKQETKLKHVNIAKLYGFWKINKSTFAADSDIAFIIPGSTSLSVTFWFEIIGRERSDKKMASSTHASTTQRKA